MCEAWAYSGEMSDEAEKTSVDPVRAGLGMRLASAREGKGLTQAQVAARFNLNKATVSAWEKGRGVPDAIRLRELAKFYDVSADSLLWEDSLSPEAMKFAVEFDSLNEVQKRTLHAMWMAYIRESASDSVVEDKMAITKNRPKFEYKRVTDVKGFTPAQREDEEKSKKGG